MGGKRKTKGSCVVLEAEGPVRFNGFFLQNLGLLKWGKVKEVILVDNEKINILIHL